MQHPARQEKRQGKAAERQQLPPIFEEFAAYEAMGEEIEDAVTTLTRHRAAFEALLEDVRAVMERTHRLFSEARFKPFHCTADEVQQAFEEVGYPGEFALDSDQEAERMVAAILHVAAHRDEQLSVARKLMMLLPEYVAERRYMDAWFILHSAYLMIEEPGKSNPFLFEMFGYGSEALVERIIAQQETLLQHLGLDRQVIGAMSFDEAEALVQAQASDPAKNVALESYFAAHPELRSYVESELWDMERQSWMLWGREDADCLYLAPEEVSPYLPILMEQLAPFEDQVQEATERGESPPPETFEVMNQTVMEVARVMAPEIFTPERIAQLAVDLKNYQRDLSQAGENKAAALAYAAGMMLRSEEQIEGNPFLIAVCFVSLRELFISTIRLSS